jgi:hypothetical protein
MLVLVEIVFDVRLDVGTSQDNTMKQLIASSGFENLQLHTAV